VRTCCLLASVLVVLSLLAGCTKPEPSVPVDTAPPQAGPEVAAPEAGNATAAAGDEGGEQSKVLVGTLRVGVPCGLAMAYQATRDLFKQRYPDVKFEDHVKNIGPMTKEVRDGKLVLDLFISLGEVEMKTLIDAGAVEGEPTRFLRQAMQLAVQLGNPLGIKALEDLGSDKVKTVAVGTQQLTIGQAGEKTLQKAGVWDKLVEGNKIVRLGQPLQTKQMVIDKKADATFIYAACSNETWKEGDPERSVIGKADVVLTVPEEHYGGMYGVAAVMSGAPNPDAAREFVKFMLEPEAQEVIAKWGYGRVDGQDAQSSDAKTQ